MHLYPVSALSGLQGRTIELSNFRFDDGHSFSGAVSVDVLESHGLGHVYLERGQESRRLTPREANRLEAVCHLTPADFAYA